MLKNSYLSLSIVLLTSVFSSGCTVSYDDNTVMQKNPVAMPVVVNTEIKEDVVPPQMVEKKAVKPMVQAERPKLVDQLQLNRQLFQAAESGDLEAIFQNLREGANLNWNNDNGETALHAASARGNREIVQLLLDSGADKDATTVQNWTPLHSAARFGHADIVKVLLSAGARSEIQNKDGKTPLMLARQLGNVEAASMFAAVR